MIQNCKSVIGKDPKCNRHEIAQYIKVSIIGFDHRIDNFLNILFLPRDIITNFSFTFFLGF